MSKYDAAIETLRFSMAGKGLQKHLEKMVRFGREERDRQAKAAIRILEQAERYEKLIEAAGGVDKNKALRIFKLVFDEAIKAEWDWEFSAEETETVEQIRSMLEALPEGGKPAPSRSPEDDPAFGGKHPDEED